MNEDISDPGHGHSPAAWTSVIIMLIAFAIGTVGFWLDVPLIVWGAGALIVVGAIVGWTMTRAGYGVGGSRYTPGDN
ncbi:DUF6704 family protein [Homoserinimonas sp. A447]